MSELTSRQKEVLVVICKAVMSEGASPSIRAICDAMGFTSTNCASGYLDILERKGCIERRGEPHARWVFVTRKGWDESGLAAKRIEQLRIEAHLLIEEIIENDGRRVWHMEKDGEVVGCTVKEWRKFWEDGGCRVAEETVGKIVVSTVFLTFDHSHGYGRPLFYETATFGAEGYALELDELVLVRHSTREEAIKGHKRLVEKLRLKRT